MSNYNDLIKELNRLADVRGNESSEGDAMLCAAEAITTLQRQLAERQKDAERMNFIELNHDYLRGRQFKRKKLWSFSSPFTNYEYDLHKTAREAIDAAIAAARDE